MQNQVAANRIYKDRLFIFLFKEKKDLLSLYNAVNGSDYANPEELEIYTMEGFIYMGMKNDISFLIDSRLVAFEHQSSYNPNMPLRGFLYMADALKKYIALNHLDIYSSRRLRLPTLRYYVFYNGIAKREDEMILYLTDSMDGEDAAEKSCAQFQARMININEGHSPEIMRKCPLLFEYSYFVSAVRRFLVGQTPLLEAVNQALDECIAKGILADVLRAHRAEVTDMLLKEYDEDFHISCEKKISYEDGVEEGIRQEKARTDEANRRAEEARQEVNEARQEADEASRRAKKADQRAEEASRRAEEADQRAEEARQEVNEARQEADEASRRAEEADQRAEEARQEANEANLRAEEAARKLEIITRKLHGDTEEQIGAALNIPVEMVRECVRSMSGKQE